MELKKDFLMKRAPTFICLSLLTTMSHALVFSITPKSGVDFPTTYNGLGDTTAYYTVLNKTASTRNDNFVKYLPPSVYQVTSDGTYADTCGATFNLASGASCTLQLSISGAVDGTNTSAENSLLICFPGSQVCAGTQSPLDIALVSPWADVGHAFEIINLSGLRSDIKALSVVYVADGSNPMPEEAWDDYSPPAGFIKNTTRQLQFQQGAFIASPGLPDGQKNHITTSDAYTWFSMSNVISFMWPYDADDYTTASGGKAGSIAAGAFVVTPPAGVVKYTVNYKGQNMKFRASENGALINRYYVTDEFGNRFIMHASNFDTAEATEEAFAAAVLPTGWTKTTSTLSEDLILQPAHGANNTYEYNLIRDSADNTYHQVAWGTSGDSVASKADVAGIPIWGGRTNNTIKVTQSFDNLIYGGGGRNVFDIASTLTTGTQTIMGFNGRTGDRINLNGQSHTTVFVSGGIQLILPSGVIVFLDGLSAFDELWITG